MSGDSLFSSIAFAVLREDARIAWILLSSGEQIAAIFNNREDASKCAAHQPYPTKIVPIKAQIAEKIARHQ